MSLEELGRIALEYRIKQRSFQQAIKRYDETKHSARPESYEQERLDMLRAQDNFNTATDAFIDAG